MSEKYTLTEPELRLGGFLRTSALRSSRRFARAGGRWHHAHERKCNMKEDPWPTPSRTSRRCSPTTTWPSTKESPPPRRTSSAWRKARLSSTGTCCSLSRRVQRTTTPCSEVPQDSRDAVKCQVRRFLPALYLLKCVEGIFCEVRVRRGIR